ncbi:MAG: metallopeptidase TldD-related protein [Pseudomonadota bacterium]
MAALACLGSLGFGKEVVLVPARTFVEDDAAVARVLSEELARSMKELRLADSPRPYYLAYAVSDVDQAIVTATFGAVTGAHGYRGRTLRTDLRVGDRKFDNSNTSESMFGGSVAALPVDDDGPALRRELWLRTDEAYKGAIETLAKKQSAAAGQADREDDGDVADFSEDKPARVKVPFPAGAPEPDQLLDVVTRLSAVPVPFPEISGSRFTGTYATVRRRFVSSEGADSDETRGAVRLDAVVETQAPDGMRLVNFVSFTAASPAGLPPLAEMQKAVRKMVAELVAMRSAPIATSGAASVLFEGPAAGQIAKLLLGDNLSGTPAPRTAAGAEERGQTSEFAERLGQKVTSPLLMVVDDPLRDVGPGKVPLFGTYRVDDEGIAAERVTLVDAGILKGLLMTRTPRKEIARSNGHARATRFGGPRAAVGNLILSARPGAARGALSRAALLAEMTRAGRGGGLGSYVVRLLDDATVPGVTSAEDALNLFSVGGSGRSAPSVKPLVVYRLTAGGKEELVRGLTLEGLVPRSLKDIGALGKDAAVYNYVDGGAGFVGIPSSVVTPSLLFSDVDVRRSTGKNKRPPLYPRPGL